MSFYSVIYIHPVTFLFAILLNTSEDMSSMKNVFNQIRVQQVRNDGWRWVVQIICNTILLVYLGVSFSKFKPFDEKINPITRGVGICSCMRKPMDFL